VYLVYLVYLEKVMVSAANTDSDNFYCHILYAAYAFLAITAGLHTC